jgi:hypothetical protein
MAAEAERVAVTIPDPPNRRAPPEPALPQLPMPGLTPPEPLRSDNLRPAQARVVLRQKVDPETDRLRALLTETLQALEEMRRLLG